jgi:LPXTG-motif cell wall-anchored protein
MEHGRRAIPTACLNLTTRREIMITCKPRGGRTLLFAGLLLLFLTAVPAFARSGDYYGPLYSSKGEVAVAQRVLLSEHYLRPGHYTAGRMDQATFQAIREFQQDHFIPNNGMLDHETMAQLMSHGSATGTGRASSEDMSRQTARQETGSSAPARNAAEDRRVARMMPETAGPIPLMTALGALLVGAGLLLARRKRD